MYVHTHISIEVDCSFNNADGGEEVKLMNVSLTFLWRRRASSKFLRIYELRNSFLTEPLLSEWGGGGRLSKGMKLNEEKIFGRDAFHVIVALYTIFLSLSCARATTLERANLERERLSKNYIFGCLVIFHTQHTQFFGDRGEVQLHIFFLWNFFNLTKSHT